MHRFIKTTETVLETLLSHHPEQTLTLPVPGTRCVWGHRPGRAVVIYCSCKLLFEQVFTRYYSSIYKNAGVTSYELAGKRSLMFPHAFPMFLTLPFFLSLGIIWSTSEARIQQYWFGVCLSVRPLSKKTLSKCLAMSEFSEQECVCLHLHVLCVHRHI